MSPLIEPQQMLRVSDNTGTKVGPGKTVLLWFLFFLICFGLGYPTLNRYDPRSAPGTGDSGVYYRLVTEKPQESMGFRGYRLLVPSVAKPFYHLAAGRVGTWDPVFFSLLI